jgi:hypothetical protein
MSSNHESPPRVISRSINKEYPENVILPDISWTFQQLHQVRSNGLSHSNHYQIILLSTPFICAHCTQKLLPIDSSEWLKKIHSVVEWQHQGSKQLILAGCIGSCPCMMLKYSVRIIPSREKRCNSNKKHSRQYNESIKPTWRKADANTPLVTSHCNARHRNLWKTRVKSTILVFLGVKSETTPGWSRDDDEPQGSTNNMISNPMIKVIKSNSFVLPAERNA